MFQYLFEFFPLRHFSALNAITNIPCGILNFTIHPLFTYGVLNGDSIGDADFSRGETFPKAEFKISQRHLERVSANQIRAWSLPKIENRALQIKFYFSKLWIFDHLIGFNSFYSVYFQTC